MMPTTLLVMLFIPTIFIVVIVLMVAQSKRTKRLWANWSKARNWVFAEKVPEVVRAFRGGPFGTGSSRRASLGYQGKFDGLPIHGFDYQYTTGSGEDSTTHYYHVDLVRLGGAVPFLSIGPENWATRTFGRDIQFENSQFNHKWNVKGESPRFAHDVIHPRTMDWLMAGQFPPFSSLWFENGCLLVASQGRKKPEQVDGYLRLLTQFLDQMPRFVLDEVGVGKLAITWDGPGVSAADQAQRMAQLMQND